MILTDFEISTLNQEIKAMIFDFSLDLDFDYELEKWWM